MKQYLAILAAMLTLAFSPSAALAKSEMAKSETAIFAGGCFWCMHAAFEQLPGVSKVRSGYTGGTVENPSYEQVSSGQTGHVEAIEVIYDQDKLAYTKLLEWFWDNVDPTDPEGQFCDKGSQYHAGIFYTTPQQKEQAQASLDWVQNKLDKPVVAFLRPAEKFYVAEDYHQSYYKKNPVRYGLYDAGCGREQTLKKIWKK